MREIKSKVAERLTTLITAAFGLVAALAWNDAVKAIFNHYYTNGENILAMIIYASIVTVIAVIAGLLVSRIANKK